jgi:hypothetical protein
VIVDPLLLAVFRTEDLIREAEQERLAAQLPQAHSGVRRELALACYRLATWLDDEDQDQYVPPSQSGPADWVPGSASV